MKKPELVVNRPSDRALHWARATLPGVSRTFALNIRLLPRGLRDSVTTGYLLCRTADALEDSWPGSGAEIRHRFDQLQAALEGDRVATGSLSSNARAAGRSADLLLVAELPRVLGAAEALDSGDRPALDACLRVMIAGMRRYAGRAADRGPGAPYLDDEAELHHYCHVVAGCVGEMLSRLFERRAGDAGSPAARARMALAPVVGEALQLTNILLDWPRDARTGRSHVPGDWRTAAGGDRELAVRLEALARAALARVPDYVRLVPPRHVRYRAFCLWPALWARASLDLAMRDLRFPDLPRRPRLGRAALWAWALRSLPALGDDRALERLFAVAG